MPRTALSPRQLSLRNTEAIELWPASLLRPRGSTDARTLARARWVLRRKRDGRFLAAELAEGLQPLVPRLAQRFYGHLRRLRAALLAKPLADLC